MEILEKGVKIALKDAQGAGLQNATVGLGWDMKDGHNVDVDASILCLKGGKAMDNGTKVIDDRNALCYYGKLELPGLKHWGDNRTGEGDGDDERITINFNQIPTAVTSLAVFVDIYAGSDNFGSINNVIANIYDNATPPADTSGAVAKCDLTEDYSGKKSVLVGEFYRHDGGWKYSAIGEGFDKSIRGGALNRWE